ncbi:MAG: hypothetical protein IJP65_04540 [Bacteroidales bacterium]|nr:hypothetical protein [Bacteroidales bacterium]
MKKMLFFSVMFFMGLTMSFAQVPLNEQLTYQTVVRNAQNRLVYNQSNVSVTVYVCHLNNATAYYSETHTGLSTNPNGLLTLMVGGGTPVSGAWNDIVWTDASIYTVISYDPGDGTVTITSDRAPVNGVPFAFSVNCSAVVGCVDDAIGNGGSTTNNAIDTVINNHLAPYEIKNCGDVTACVDNAIKDGTSTTNNAIDTVIEHHLTPYEIKNCGDVTNCVKTEIGNGSSDINHGIDTIVENHLVPYTIKDCSDVTTCVKTEIENGGSDLNHTIDTLVANNIHDSLVYYTIKDCDDVVACPIIQNMRDSIQSNYEEIQHLTTDLNTLETRVNTFNTHVCDSVKDCVAAQIHDSLVAHPVYNSTITFQQAGETDQTITLNQSTDQTITIATFSQKSARFIATAGLTDFTLPVPSGKTLETTNHLVQMYINGVYVGDTTDGVVTASGTTATYVPAVNGGYALVAGDRVNFVFWVK